MRKVYGADSRRIQYVFTFDEISKILLRAFVEGAELGHRGARTGAPVRLTATMGRDAFLPFLKKTLELEGGGPTVVGRSH